MAANYNDQQLIGRLMELRVKNAAFGSKEELHQEIAVRFADMEILRLRQLNNLNDLPASYDQYRKKIMTKINCRGTTACN